MKEFLQKNWQLFAVIGIGLVVLMFFFKPQLEGYGVKQHDVKEWKGMSNETDLYRAETGEEPMWTNSAFAGMPTEQISMTYPGNWFKTILNQFFKLFPVPFGTIFLHFLSFIVFARLLKLNWWVGLFGALAFSFSSYELIVIQAGHVTKSNAVALIPAVLGAFIYAFRHKRILGLALFGLFFTLQIAANHLQITYYFMFVLLFVGVYFLVEAIRAKQFKNFAITSVGIILVSVLSVVINSGNIVLTNDYAKQTIRSKNDVSILPTGEKSTVQSDGLDKDYITQWSYGIGETFTLLSPYVKGGASEMLADSPFADKISSGEYGQEEVQAISNSYAYWGEQPITSGPVYVGVVVLFLAFLGLFLMKDAIKWPLFLVTVLAIMLSWGKNFMGLTNFFIDHVPGYDKFRAVTIILIVVELTIPVMGMLFLNYLLKARNEIIAEKKKLWIVSGAFVVLLLGVKFVGLGDGYSSKMEMSQYANLSSIFTQQIVSANPADIQSQLGIDNRNMQQVKQFVDQQVDSRMRSLEYTKKFRKDIFNSSMNRSILFALLICGVLYLFVRIENEKNARVVLLVGTLMLCLADLVPVGYNYLGAREDQRTMEYKFWEDKALAEFPIAANKADAQIMEMELAQNQTLKQIVNQAEQKAKKEADERGIEGVARMNMINSYRFHALKMATNYRVFDLSGAFSSSRASYFHKSVGGYHGAKLRNIQNLMDFQLSKTNNKVMNMLNIRYFIQRTQNETDTALVNYGALGNAWFVKQVEAHATPDDEIRALGNQFKLENKGEGQLLVNGVAQKDAIVYGNENLGYFIPGRDTIPVQLTIGLQQGQDAYFAMDVNGNTNFIPVMTQTNDTTNSFKNLIYIRVENSFEPATEVVMLESEKAKLKQTKFTGEGKIALVKTLPNKLTYQADVKGDQLAVFSEIYYPIGWKAYVDGKETPILKVDYLLRGLELTSGKHKIEFVYDLPKYHSMTQVARISSILMLLFLGFAGYNFWKNRNKKA